MNRKPPTPPHEGPGKSTVDAVEKPLTVEQAREAMDKFKTLTRGLLNVSNSALQAELKRPQKPSRAKTGNLRRKSK